MYIKVTSGDFDHICSQIKKAKSQGDGAIGKVSRARNVEQDIASRMNISHDLSYLSREVSYEINRLDTLVRAIRQAEDDFEDADKDVRSKSKITAAKIRKAQRDAYWEATRTEIAEHLDKLKIKMKNLYEALGAGGTVAIGAIAGGITHLVMEDLHVDDLIDSYKNKGAVYQAFQYGKCAYKIGKGACKLVGSVLSITTIAAIPVGICGAVTATNDIANGLADLSYVTKGEYDKVGQTNYLEDFLIDKGGEVGEMLGNEAAGETFGKVLYTGLEAVDFLDDTDKFLKSAGNLNTVITGTTGTSFVWGKTTFDDILNNEFKLYKPIDWVKGSFMDPTSPMNFIVDAAHDIHSMYKGGVKFADSYTDLLTSSNTSAGDK